MQNREHIKAETGLRVEDAIITPSEDGVARIVVRKRSGLTPCAPCRTFVGEAEVAQVVEVPER